LKPSLDLSVEAWGGRADGQVFNGNGGFALVAMSSLRIRTLPRGAVIVGAGVGAQSVFGDALCLFPAGSTSCAPDYPDFSWLMAHVGVERTWGATVRVLAGPAVFRSEKTRTVAGLQGRADVATPALAHLALLLSARGAILPRFQGRRHEMLAFGIGIRVGG